MKTLIFIIILILSTLTGYSQDNLLPKKKEVRLLDSIIMARFKESRCYDSTEVYHIDHIYRYNLGNLKKVDFINNTVLKKIKKSYTPYWVFNPDSIKSKIPDSLSYNRILTEADCDTIFDLLTVSDAFIVNKNSDLVAICDNVDNLIAFCVDEDSYSFSHNLFNLLKSKKFKLIFTLAYTVGGFYLAEDYNNKLVILVAPH